MSQFELSPRSVLHGKEQDEDCFYVDSDDGEMKNATSSLSAHESFESNNEKENENERYTISRQESQVSSSSSKSSVQSRLEQWQRPNPTKQSLTTKLVEATKRRADAFSSKMNKLSQKQERRDQSLIAKNHILQSKKNQLLEKHSNAAQRKSDALSKRSSALTQKHQTTQKRTSQSKVEQAVKLQTKKEQNHLKMMEAIQRKESILSDQTTNLANSLQSKQERTVQSKITQSNNVSQTKQKNELKLTKAMERKQQQTLSKKQQQSPMITKKPSLQEEEQQQKQHDAQHAKFINAIKRKEQTIIERSNQITQNLQRKQQRVSEVQQSKDVELWSQKHKLEVKMFDANERKERMVSEKVQNSALYWNKIRGRAAERKERNQMEVEELKSRVEKKSMEAMERKEFNINQRREGLKSASKEKDERRMESERKKKMETISMRDMFEQKMKSVMKRKNEMLSRSARKREEAHASIKERANGIRESRNARKRQIQELNEKKQLAMKQQIEMMKKEEEERMKVANERRMKALEFKRNKKEQEKNLKEHAIDDDLSAESMKEEPITTNNISFASSTCQAENQNTVQSSAQGKKNAEKTRVPTNHKPKSRIQLKLENWTRKTPTKESIVSKQKAASQRRAESVSSLINSAKQHLSHVQQVHKKVDLKSNEDTSTLNSKLMEKTLKAEQNKQKITTERVQNITTKNKEKVERVQVHKQALENHHVELKQKLTEKVDAVVQRKEKLITGNVKKVAKPLKEKELRAKEVIENQARSIKDLEVKIDEKQGAAAERRKEELQKKQEKANLNSHKENGPGKYATEVDSTSELEENLRKKLDRASKRKDHFITSRVHKLKLRFNKLKLAASNTRTKRETDIIALDNEINKRSAQAQSKKAHLTEERVQKLSAKHKDHQDRASLSQQSVEQMRINIEQKMTQRVEAANERKQHRLNNTVVTKLSQSLTIKKQRGRDVKDSKDQKAKELERSTGQKMADAMRRRKGVLSERMAKISKDLKMKQEHGAKSIALKDAGVSTKKLKLETKLAEATKRKDDALTKKTSALSEELKIKQERGAQSIALRDADLSMTRDRLETKLAEAAKRKDDALAVKTTNLSEELKSKQTRSIKSRQRHDVHCASMKEKLDIKLNDAVDRKNTIQASKVKSSEEKHSSISLRAEKSRKDHENLRMQIYARHKKRLLSAAQRKQSLTNQRKKEKSKSQDAEDVGLLLLEPIEEETNEVGRVDEDSIASHHQQFEVIPDDPCTFRDLLNSGMYMDLNPSVRSDSDSAISFDAGTRPSTADSWVVDAGKFNVKDEDESAVSYSVSSGKDEATKETESIMTGDDLYSLDTLSMRDNATGKNANYETRTHQETKEYQIELSPEEFMRSLTLAEEAAKKGMTEFTTESKLKVLEHVELSGEIQRKLRRQARRKKIRGILEDTRQVLGNSFKSLTKRMTTNDLDRQQTVAAH